MNVWLPRPDGVDVQSSWDRGAASWRLVASDSDGVAMAEQA